MFLARVNINTGRFHNDIIHNMLNISIKTIEDQKQRYDTVGDYFTDKSGKTQILISDMNDSRYEFLIAMHELVESMLCKERGVTDVKIDQFDFEYENNRSKGDSESIPGDQLDCPYYKEHQFATKIEKLLAEELNVDWNTYNNACAKLTETN